MSAGCMEEVVNSTCLKLYFAQMHSHTAQAMHADRRMNKIFGGLLGYKGGTFCLSTQNVTVLFVFHLGTCKHA